MTDIKQRMIACLLALAVVSTSVHAQTAAPSGSDMFVDLVVTRPLGLLGIVAGSAAFVIALPFTIPSGSVGRSAEELVKKPVRYTFKRPLGEFPDDH
ncbi:MAG: hypothetical protein ABI771_08095 [Betaproteobacteria bacterium]